MAANKDDIRTDAITGKLSLDNFDEKSYLRRQSRSLEPKFNTLFSDSPELNRADALAIHKIAKNREWSREDSEQYISANNDLITRYGGPSQKAIAKARSHHLKKGFFQQRLLIEEAIFGANANTDSSTLFGYGTSYLEQGSLADDSMNSLYQQGHLAPMTTLG